MMLQVEEDPSSQFVDFTNATALEQFVADVEQTLIAWQLANKGHAAAEARRRPPSSSPAHLHTPVTHTRVLEYAYQPDTPSATVNYALTLFPSLERERAPTATTPITPTTPTTPTPIIQQQKPPPPSKQWVRGREHFTPTMLAIADSWRDESAWGEFWQHDQAGGDGSREDDASLPDVATLARNAKKWFGVDEFLLIGRTTRRSEAQRARQAGQPPTGAGNGGGQQRRRLSRQRMEDAAVDLSEWEEERSQGTADERSSSATAGSEALATTASAVSEEKKKDREKTDPEELFQDGSMDANEANLVLSAVHLALTNSNCTLPVFVPVWDLSRGAWLGSAVPGATGNVSVTFETDSVPEINANQSCLSGLMDFFHLKLQLPPHVEEQCRVARGGHVEDLPVGMWVSAAFQYAWRREEDPRELEERRAASLEGTTSDWRYAGGRAALDPNVQKIADKLFNVQSFAHGPVTEFLAADSVGKTAPVATPSPRSYWGTVTSPLESMHLTAVWPNMREGSYVDNAVHSTLDPATAPEWMLRVQFEPIPNAVQARWRRHPDLARKPAMPVSRLLTNLVHAYAKSRELSRDVLVSELAPTIPSPPSSTMPMASRTAAPPSNSPSSSLLASPSPPSSQHSGYERSRLPDGIPAARAAAVLGNAIGSLTSSIVSAATWKGTDVEEIQRIVAALFDENSWSAKSYSSGIGGSVGDGREKPFAVASAPSPVAHGTSVGELVSVLACQMGQLHGINAMSLLWVEFVKALRERWFQQRLLPLLNTNGSNDGYAGYDKMASSLDSVFFLESKAVDLPGPDFSQCLLYQKLQLLNCCILRQAKLSRSSYSSMLSPRTGADLTSVRFDDDADDDESRSDDEFFDSIEQHSEHSSLRTSDGMSSRLQSSTADTPRGVKGELPGMFCLLTKSSMMEPITQVAVPQTEDVAKQKQDLLSRLGVCTESTILRQQLQSGALVSDMQAFKAANPGACLADFIRWYSPKDWLEFSSESTPPVAIEELPADGENVWWFANQGMLSERMRAGLSTSSVLAQDFGSIPPSSSHLWYQTWMKSEALPVSKQKTLFDPVEESEKLYHYLETISPHEMFHQMLVGAISSCYWTLEQAALPFRVRQLRAVDSAFRVLSARCDHAVARLDEALAESQVAYPTGRDKHEEQERAKKQLQVAFEMALDACWQMARTMEEVEMLLSQTSVLLHYLSPTGSGKATTEGDLTPESLQLVDLLLQSSSLVANDDEDESITHVEGSSSRTVSEHRSEMVAVLRNESLRRRVSTLILKNPSSGEPTQREYVLRCICPRPYLDEYQYRDDENGSDNTKLGLVGGQLDKKAQPGFVAMSPENDLLDLVDESPVVVNRMYASFTKHTVRFSLTLAESEF